MNKRSVPLPPELADLTTGHDGIALIGPDGQPAGYFVPPEMYEAVRTAFYDWANAQVSDEDLRRSFASPGRHSMDEVLKLVEGD